MKDTSLQHDLDNAIGFWLNLTFRKIRNTTSQLLAPYKINPEQWALLVRLWQKDERTQTELAEVTFRDKPSVTRMIDGLETEGYVVRARNIEDGRSYRILLTKKGRQLQYELVPIVKKLIKHWTRCIPENELEITRNTLKTLYQNLE